MSLRKAIDHKCKDCIYDPLEKGTWRSQVTNCSCTDCPLFAIRPRPHSNTANVHVFRRILHRKTDKPRLTNAVPAGKVLVLSKRGKFLGYVNKPEVLRMAA